MNPQPTNRVIPTKITHLISSEFKLRLTWRERLKIACGYNLKFTYHGYAAHSPGHIDQKLRHEVVNEL